MRDHSEVWVLIEKIHTEPPTRKARFNLHTYRLEVTEATSSLIERELPGINYLSQDRNTWKQALSVLYQTVQSRRKLLLTWSHGAGFGFNVETDNIINTSDTPSDIIEVTGRYLYLSNREVELINDQNFFPVIDDVDLIPGEYLTLDKEESYDCNKAELLWMSDFSDVLREGLKGNKIDLLLMMNCNMQLFENGFLLKDSVEILIGPESQMWAYGYDYSSLLNIISTDPETSNRDIAETVIRDYEALHHRMGHVNYLKRTTMFANDLSQHSLLTPILNQTLRSLLTEMGTIKPQLLTLRQDYFYSVSGRPAMFLVDTKLWMDTIYSQHGLPLSIPEYDKFLVYYNKIKVAGYVGQEFLDRDANSLKKFGHSGSSLFYPKTNTFSSPARIPWCAYFSEQRSSDFQKASLWDEFIKALNQP